MSVCVSPCGFVRVCVKESEERGTDWYIEGKDAAGETSEARVILGEYSGLSVIKGRQHRKKRTGTTNTLSDRANDDSEDCRRGCLA